MTAEDYTDSERTRLLIASCVAGFITPVLSTMISLSLTSIGEDFGVGSHDLAYLNTMFLLSCVLFMVPLARLADIYGKRRFFILGLLLTAVGCLLAAVSPSFTWLMMCRIIAGAGSAALVSSSISLVVDVYPPEKRGSALGIQTMCTYLGMAAGPPLGGVLNQFLGWQSLFYFIVPIALVGAILMMTFRHEIRPMEGRSFDVVGTVLYGFGIVLAMGGLLSLPETWAYIAIVVGVVLIAAFARWESRTKDRLLNVHLFRSRVFAGSNVAAFLNYAACNSISYFMALYLQSIGELTSSEAGMLMLVQAAVQAILTPIFGRLSDRVKDKRILPTVGMAICAVGVSLFLFYGTEMNIYLVLATMLVVGTGNGIFSTPNTSVVMGASPPDQTGEASGALSVMRQSGMMLSMGIAMLIISTIMGSTDNLVPENYGLFVDVIHLSFTICVIMCIVGVIVSALRGKGTGPAAEAAE